MSKGVIMNEENVEQLKITDNSKKSILARGCDPVMSLSASKAIPPLIGSPEYVATTSDAEFIEKLKSRRWSVVFFAPGACRYDAANKPIPGGNSMRQNWTLNQYHELVRELQGDLVQIVRTQDERETIGLLKDALASARQTS